MKTITVKTSELTGAALDWAVMKFDPECEGMEWLADSTSGHFFGVIDDDQVEKVRCIFLSHKLSLRDKITYRREGLVLYSPSTNWSYGGPLIENFKITLYWHPTYNYRDGDSKPCWEAQPHDVLLVAPDEYDPVGDTALIAACRAIVASKIGDTVEVPEQLLEVNHGD